ncbi:SpaA isopeptide-forming pilin-related protein [Lactococcus insecticola]|uniref:Prealbumin-like fold domain-containing protein n=1 Tax=Pseudolactococcus insecticola TaxID=2709158 RepID=A0A6A0B977_9LACT|nr:SpaA isopeptide-forming pilin-related protein [Lactococcus insecticola]GFH40387.1 hypothetical protein Hs20B_07850 [Lactococcus insecticola]
MLQKYKQFIAMLALPLLVILGGMTASAATTDVHLNDLTPNTTVKVYDVTAINDGVKSPETLAEEVADAAAVTTASDVASTVTLENVSAGKHASYLFVEENAVQTAMQPIILSLPQYDQETGQRLSQVELFPKHYALDFTLRFQKHAWNMTTQSDAGALSGADFVLTKKDGSGKTLYLKTSSDGSLTWSDKASDKSLEQFTSDKKGLVSTGDYKLPAGDYTFVETKAPNGYELNHFGDVSVAVAENGEVRYTLPDASGASLTTSDSDAAIYYNYPASQVTFTKWGVKQIQDDNGNVIDSIDVGAQAGFEFLAYRVDEDYNYTWLQADGSFKASEFDDDWNDLSQLSAKRFVSDENGQVTLDLPTGEYYLYEMVAPRASDDADDLGWTQSYMTDVRVVVANDGQVTFYTATFDDDYNLVETAINAADGFKFINWNIWNDTGTDPSDPSEPSTPPTTIPPTTPPSEPEPELELHPVSFTKWGVHQTLDATSGEIIDQYDVGALAGAGFVVYKLDDAGNQYFLQPDHKTWKMSELDADYNDVSMVSAERFISDAAGQVALDLPEGTYYFFETDYPQEENPEKYGNWVGAQYINDVKIEIAADGSYQFTTDEFDADYNEIETTVTDAEDFKYLNYRLFLPDTEGEDPSDPTPEPSTPVPSDPTPEPSTSVPSDPTPEPSTSVPSDPTPEPSTPVPSDSTPEPSTTTSSEVPAVPSDNIDPPAELVPALPEPESFFGEFGEKPEMWLTTGVGCMVIGMMLFIFKRRGQKDHAKDSKNIER